MEKLKKLGSFLFADSRKLSTRMLISALASFSFVLTYLLVGPVETFFANTMHFEYTVAEAMLPVCLTALIAFAVLFGISFLLRGKVLNWYVSLLLGLSVAAYVQIIFFNSSVGVLDGTAVEWQHMSAAAVVGLAVWAVIIFVIFAIESFSKKLWRYAVIFLSVLICVMQLTNMVAVMLTSEIEDKSSITVTRDGELELSDKHNVIILVADRFDIKYANEVMENDPQYFDEFDGFTWYKNTISHFSRSFPNVPLFFTTEEYYYDVEYDEYMEKAWKDNHFLEDMKEAGYSPRIYVRQQFVNPDSEYMLEYCDNYKEVGRNVDNIELEKQMLNLAIYRCAPVALKPFFETDTSEINSAFALEKANQLSNVDSAFYKRLTETGLSINSDIAEKGTFSYHHFHGCHSPYVFDENCQAISDKGSVEAATRGVLVNISEYLRQLKELGIYDSSTIFVTTDHGYTGAYTELDSERVMTLFYKPAGSKGEIEISNSPQQLGNVRATVMKEMGLDYSKYGTPIDEIEEDADIVRYFYMSGSSEDGKIREKDLLTYEVVGDANDFSNWKLVDSFPIKYPFLDN